MMIILLVTYLVFLVSVAIYFVYYTMWARKSDPTTANKVFFWWSVAVFLIFCVQLVLLSVFWSLSKESIDPVVP